MSTLRRTVSYPHPTEAVWAALTDPAALALWLMPNDFVPRVGHRFTLRTDPGPGWDGVVHCEVLALDPPTHMAWRWRGGPVDTIVRFDLEPVAGGTRLRFEQSGFGGVQGNLVRLLFGIGFRTMYRRKLPAYLAGRAVAPEAADRHPLALLLARLATVFTRRRR